MNRFAFSIYDMKREKVYNIDISENGSIYLMSCTCPAPNYRKCEHLLSVLSGNKEYLKQQGIANQQQLIHNLLKFPSGFEIVNKVRLRKGLPPFCKKCHQSTDEHRHKFQFWNRFLNRQYTEYYCHQCQSKHEL